MEVPREQCVSTQPKLEENTLYGIDNMRRRTFVVGIDNDVNSIPIKYVLLDTGCSADLINIEEGGLQKIIDAFPRPKYNLDIHAGGGVATVQDCVLCISDYNYTDKSIEWTLSATFNKYTFRTNRVRFHLCYDDAVTLLALFNAGKVIIANADKLDSYIKIMNAVASIELPTNGKIEINKRRRHALLGRSVMDLIDNTYYSAHGVTMIANKLSANIDDANMHNIRASALTHMSQHMKNINESFDTLENQYDPDITVDYMDMDE